jgi:single-strand DNA-binding protein
MAFDANSVVITGRLGADVELRKTNSGVSVANLRVAVTESAGADKEPRTTWLTAQAWQRVADAAAAGRKGQRVSIIGRLRVDSWQGPQGENRNKVVVDANHVFIEGALTNVNTTGANASPSREELASVGLRHHFDDGEIPF